MTPGRAQTRRTGCGALRSRPPAATQVGPLRSGVPPASPTPRVSKSGPVSIVLGLGGVTVAIVPVVGVVALLLAAVGVGLGIRALLLADRGVISDRALGVTGIVISTLAATVGAVQLGVVVAGGGSSL